MSTIRIPLNSRKYPGLYALIDEADFELVSQYRWGVYSHPHTTYAGAKSNRKTIYLHRLIIGAEKNQSVDHINNNGLDCRRANLRLCSDAENKRNISRLPRRNTTGFLGIEKLPNGRYRSTISDKGKNIHIGVSATPEEAAHARDEVARELYGEFGVYNFPRAGEKGIKR